MLAFSEPSIIPAGVHALDLWDDEPGSDWTTSFLLGNGHLGAMLGMGTFQVRESGLRQLKDRSR